MAILIKFKKTYIPHKAFRPVAHAYYPLGSVVKLIAQRTSSSGAWKAGDVGTVTGFFPDGGADKVNPDRDLYRVELAERRNPAVVLGYFYYFELDKFYG